MHSAKLLAVSGTILTLSSLLLGAGFWGYQTGVLLLQAGILALGLGLFLRLDKEPKESSPLPQLYNLESSSPTRAST